MKSNFKDFVAKKSNNKNANLDTWFKNYDILTFESAKEKEKRTHTISLHDKWQQRRESLRATCQRGAECRVTHGGHPLVSRSLYFICFKFFLYFYVFLKKYLYNFYIQDFLNKQFICSLLLYFFSRTTHIFLFSRKITIERFSPKTDGHAKKLTCIHAWLEQTQWVESIFALSFTYMLLYQGSWHLLARHIIDHPWRHSTALICVSTCMHARIHPRLVPCRTSTWIIFAPLLISTHQI